MKRIIAAVLALFLVFTLFSSAAALQQEDNSSAPSAIVLTEDGGYIFTDVFNKVLKKVSPDGSVSHFAGKVNLIGLNGEPIGQSSDGSLADALFTSPWGIAPFLDGYVVTDSDAHLIRYVDSTSVQTAAGSGKPGSRNGTGMQATFSRPTGLAAGDSGEVYIADTDNGLIRRLDPDGKVTTFYTGLSEPTGLCWQNGALYVAETGAHCISRIENGVCTVVAGKKGQDGYADGSVKAATLRDPQGVAVAEDGTIYIADTGNGAVRKLSGGLVTTLISSGEENAPVLPRSLTIRGSTLLITDPFGCMITELSLAEKQFDDIPMDEWYASAVHQALQLGLVNGMGNNRFAPKGNVTRAQMAQMLANLQMCLDHDVIPAGDIELSDVVESAWYHDTACWAAELELLSIENDCFLPNREITREDMAVALFRFAQALGVDTSDRSDLSAFTDAHLISETAEEAMAWSCAAGLIRGVSGTQLDPVGSATRAQMTQVIIRFLALLQNNE